MLALATGWTPAALAQLPGQFRRACHWALYAQTVAGPEGFEDPAIPSGLPAADRLALMQQKAQIGTNRVHLYPEGD